MACESQIWPPCTPWGITSLFRTKELIFETDRSKLSHFTRNYPPVSHSTQLSLPRLLIYEKREKVLFDSLSKPVFSLFFSLFDFRTKTLHSTCSKFQSKPISRKSILALIHEYMYKEKKNAILCAKRLASW